MLLHVIRKDHKIMAVKITHLKRIEIKNLWGEMDIDWQLDPNVNILIGINGSGKTTLLDLIDSIVHQKSLKMNYGFDEVNLFFNDNYLMHTKSIKNRDGFGIVTRNVKASSNENNESSCESHFLKESDIRHHDVKLIKIDKVSTFDMSQQDKIEEDRAFYQTTDLDNILRKLVNDFKGYQLKLRNLEREETTILDQKIKTLALKDNATTSELQALRKAVRHKEIKVSEIYQQKNQFLFELNTLFKGTHKVVDFDKNNALSLYEK